MDEGHIKQRTLTFSQHKKMVREGFKKIAKSLDIKLSNPKNPLQDITVYNFNFPKLLKYLDEASELYDRESGLWFKEEKFRAAANLANPTLSKKL
ncbi:MAG: hypothetical protein ACE5FT_05430 [Candidatus Nanoarchaeia archaeon]